MQECIGAIVKAIKQEEIQNGLRRMHPGRVRRGM